MVNWFVVVTRTPKKQLLRMGKAVTCLNDEEFMNKQIANDRRLLWQPKQRYPLMWEGPQRGVLYCLHLTKAWGLGVVVWQSEIKDCQLARAPRGVIQHVQKN